LEAYSQVTDYAIVIAGSAAIILIHTKLLNERFFHDAVCSDNSLPTLGFLYAHLQDK
jgi:hypothetical protein